MSPQNIKHKMLYKCYVLFLFKTVFNSNKKQLYSYMKMWLKQHLMLMLRIMVNKGNDNWKFLFSKQWHTVTITSGMYICT